MKSSGGITVALFRKNPAEKKLKELTGGRRISKEFKNRLKMEGLTISHGTSIYSQLKKEIKTGKVNENNIEKRLEELISQRKEQARSRHGGSRSSMSTGTGEFHIISEGSLEKMAKDDKVKEIKFLINQEHNVKECPKCAATLLKSDRFCHKCGVNVLSASAGAKSFSTSKAKSEDKSSNLEKEPIEKAFKKAEESADSLFKEGPSKQSSFEEPLKAKVSQTEDNSTLDELSELEKLYSKKVSSKYSPKFKFAYVLYLNEIKKKPSKELPEDKYLQLYDTRVSKLKKQALEDNYIEYGNPLIAAESATVKEIKDVLKEHDLKVSGKKEDLIERLGQNLSEEDLKKAFPKKVLSISDKGNEFIEKNRYVLYYDKTTPLRTHMEVDEYDSIFEDADDLSDENIYALLIDHLIKREDDFIMNKKWSPYRYNFMILARVYKDSGDEYKVLDCDFKLFIAGINNFSDYTNKSEPFNGYVGKTYSNELIDLMHSLSLTIDELKDRFGQSYDELRYPELKISKEESLLYLLKLFSGEDSEDITSEIRSKYPVPMF